MGTSRRGPRGRGRSPPAVCRSTGQADRRARNGRCLTPRRQRPRHRGPPGVLQAGPRPHARADRAIPRQPPHRHAPAPVRAGGGEDPGPVPVRQRHPGRDGRAEEPATHQTVEHAKHQYRTDRDPANVTLGRRALVHFAIDPESVEMTTRLAGEKTGFLRSTAAMLAARAIRQIPTATGRDSGSRSGLATLGSTCSAGSFTSSPAKVRPMPRRCGRAPRSSPGFTSGTPSEGWRRRRATKGQARATSCSIRPARVSRTQSPGLPIG